MAINCGKLSSGYRGYDCDNPIVVGVKPNAYIINLNEIDQALTEFDDTKKNVIKTLALVSGARAYEGEGLDKTVSENIALVNGAYLNTWDHNVVMRIFNKSVEIKDFIDDLKLSRVAVILENMYVKQTVTDPEKKGETVYEIYGFHVGLRLKECTQDGADNENYGGYILTLGCDENAKEPLLPLTIFNTDLATTRTAIEDLLNPTP